MKADNVEKKIHKQRLAEDYLFLSQQKKDIELKMAIIKKILDNWDEVEIKIKKD